MPDLIHMRYNASGLQFPPGRYQFKFVPTGYILEREEVPTLQDDVCHYATKERHAYPFSTMPDVQLHVNPAFMLWKCALQWAVFAHNGGTVAKITKAMNLPQPAQDDLRERLTSLVEFASSLEGWRASAQRWSLKGKHTLSARTSLLSNSRAGSISDSALGEAVPKMPSLTAGSTGHSAEASDKGLKRRYSSISDDQAKPRKRKSGVGRHTEGPVLTQSNLEYFSESKFVDDGGESLVESWLGGLP